MYFNNCTSGIMTSHSGSRNKSIAANTNTSLYFSAIIFWLFFNPPGLNSLTPRDRFLKTTTGNFEPIGRRLARLQGILQPDINGIKTHLLCGDIQLHLCGKPDLGDSMPSHGTRGLRGW